MRLPYSTYLLNWNEPAINDNAVFQEFEGRTEFNFITTALDQQGTAPGQAWQSILPQPNEHVVKVSISPEKFPNLHVGQKVIIKTNANSPVNANLEGRIDFIGPAFSKGTYYVTVKLPASVNKQLWADPTSTTLDSIRCTAGFTVDTISYLKYIFQAVHL